MSLQPANSFKDTACSNFMHKGSVVWRKVDINFSCLVNSNVCKHTQFIILNLIQSFMEVPHLELFRPVLPHESFGLLPLHGDFFKFKQTQNKSSCVHLNSQKCHLFGTELQNLCFLRQQVSVAKRFVHFTSTICKLWVLYFCSITGTHWILNTLTDVLLDGARS